LLAQVVAVSECGVAVLVGTVRGWMPASEWSEDAADWCRALERLEEGDLLDVSPMMAPHDKEDVLMVSRRLFQQTDVDASWQGVEKTMCVSELTRELLRGHVGNIAVVAEQGTYAHALDRLTDSAWAHEHAALGPGDEVAGRVSEIAGRLGVPILDLGAALDARAVETILAGADGANELQAQAASAPTAERGTAPVHPAAGIGPVLLVEDDARCRESLKALLRQRGFAVNAVGSAADALAVVGAGMEGGGVGSTSHGLLGLLVVDVNLGPIAKHHDGLELAQRLRETAKCPVLLITGEDATAAKRRQWGALEVNACLLKPFAAEEFLGALDEALSQEAAPWPQLLGGGEGPEPADEPGTHPAPPQALTPQAALARLSLRRAGTAIHVFRLHQRSLKARSIVDVNGDRLQWVALRGKIAKSPIRDVALDDVVVLDTDCATRARHYWTQRMMPYSSFCGVPVRVPGPYKYALVCFHAEASAFDQAYLAAAQLCAEELGRVLEGSQLTSTRAHETLLVATGLTLESIAHELRTDLVTLAADVGRLKQRLSIASDTPSAESADVADIASGIDVVVRSAQSKVSALTGVRGGARIIDVQECARLATRRCMDVVYRTLPRHAPQIHIDMPGVAQYEPWHVRGTLAGLTIVLFNVLLNAAQQLELMIGAGMARAGRIWTTYEVRECADGHRRGLIRIHDSGPGIHADDWDRVFEPGYSTKPGGTGLGLYICKFLLRQVRGSGRGAEVRLTRSVVWGGSTFTVALPLETPQSEG
jgi:signal transduction histidine kinase/DNA-binding response OmpR family regulator